MKAISGFEYRSLPMAATRYAAVCVTAAGLMALSARASFHLPFTPVPVTMQVFTALLCGLVLGSRLGAASQMLYVAAGAAGLPVFADGKGTAAVLGPTGGYIVGFIAAAFLAGLIAERLSSRPTLGASLGAAAGVVVIYLCGASWLAVWLAAVGERVTIGSAWLLGTAPFLGVDCLKAIAAAAIATGGLTQRLKPRATI